MDSINCSKFSVKRINLRFLFRTTLVLLLSFLMISCGGGTVGTGDVPDTQFQGTVKSISGVPLTGVQISIAETGDFAVTDQAGSFALKTSRPGQTATLLVESDELNQRLTVSDIPSEDSVVTLAIEVDDGSGLIQIQSISIDVGEIVEIPGGNMSANSSDTTNQPTDNDSKFDQPAASRTKFDGSLVFVDGTPVKGATITIPAFKVHAQTNAQGKFALDTPASEEVITMIVRYQREEAKIKVKGIPRDRASTIHLKLVINSLPFGPQISSVRPGIFDVSIESIKIRAAQ